MVSNRTVDHVKKAIQAGAVHVSVHARDEAVDDDLLLQDIEVATIGADCIEDYPDFELY